MDRDQRGKTPIAERKHTERNMWSSSPKEMITMWSEKSAAPENCLVLLPQVLYCNSYEGLCQVLLTIKISTQNLIRSKQRKSFSKGVDRVAFIWYNITVHEKNRIIHIATLVDGVRSIFCDMVEYLLYARDAFLFY